MYLKKPTCFLLVALLLLTLAACGSTGNNAATTGTGSTAAVKENFNPEGYPIVNEKITLTALQGCRNEDNIDFQNLPFYQKLEEKTNIHVEFEVVKGSDWDTKLNLMFASGQYTDLILKGGVVNDDEYGANQGILIPLDGLIETCMPNYWERLQMDNVNASIPATDGKTYFIGYIGAQNTTTFGHTFINKTWLNNLSLKMPANISELTEVLRKFKSGDPNQNGQKDEIPYQARMKDDITTGIYLAFASWGIPENGKFVMLDDNDKVLLTPKQNGYRQCLEWLNTLYKEGLIDPEFISQDASVLTAKLANKNNGYFAQWRLKNMGYDEIINDYECILPLPAEGFSPKLPRNIELPVFGAGLTKTNKYVKESLRWIDAQMETETMMSSSNGVLNEDFKLSEEGKYEVITVPEDLLKKVPGVNGQFFAPATYYFDVYKMAPHRLEKAEYCTWYEEKGVLENKSYLYLTALSPMTTEEKTQLSRLETEIKKFMEESITKFITTGVDDNGWNTFLSRLDSLKADEYVKLYQDAYDKYLAVNK